MEKHLIIMAGLPGTGKTVTAEKLLGGLENYKLVSQNEIRRNMGIKKMPKTQETVLREIDIETAELLRKGKGVIFDSVNRYLFRRHQMYGVASCCGKQVLTLECVCSEDEAKRRMKYERKRKKGDRLIKDPIDPRVYDKLASLWEPIFYDFRYPGEDHVSYITYDTEKNKIYRRTISRGIGRFLNKIEKILIK